MSGAKESAWQRLYDGWNEDFAPIHYWSADYSSHEDAAIGFAFELTQDDPDYYDILENQGLEVKIMSPDGEIRTMRLSGEVDFKCRATEVPNPLQGKLL